MPCACIIIVLIYWWHIVFKRFSFSKTFLVYLNRDKYYERKTRITIWIKAKLNKSDGQTLVDKTLLQKTVVSIVVKWFKNRIFDIDALTVLVLIIGLFRYVYWLNGALYRPPKWVVIINGIIFFGLCDIGSML